MHCTFSRCTHTCVVQLHSFLIIFSFVNTNVHFTFYDLGRLTIWRMDSSQWEHSFSLFAALLYQPMMDVIIDTIFDVVTFACK